MLMADPYYPYATPALADTDTGTPYSSSSSSYFFQHGNFSFLHHDFYLLIREIIKLAFSSLLSSEDKFTELWIQFVLRQILGILSTYHLIFNTIN